MPDWRGGRFFFLPGVLSTSAALFFRVHSVFSRDFQGFRASFFVFRCAFLPAHLRYFALFSRLPSVLLSFGALFFRRAFGISRCFQAFRASFFVFRRSFLPTRLRYFALFSRLPGAFFLFWRAFPSGAPSVFRAVFKPSGRLFNFFKHIF